MNGMVERLCMNVMAGRNVQPCMDDEAQSTINMIGAVIYEVTDGGTEGMAAVIGFVTLVLAIFCGDLYIKNRVEKYIPARGTGKCEQKMLGGRLILRRHHNRGMILNAGERKQPLVAAVSLALTAVLTVVFLISLGHRGNNLLRAGLAFLLGGAFSNTYDRMKRKYVVDYLSFGVKWTRLRQVVFNISDFCIMIGALLAALAGMRGA